MAGIIAPKLFPGGGIQRINVIAGRQVIDAVHHQRREVPGRELLGIDAPYNFSRHLIQRVGVVDHREVHHPVQNHRRRLDVAAHLDLPGFLSGGGVQGVELSIACAGCIYPAAHHRRGNLGPDWEGRLGDPRRCAGNRIHRVDFAVSVGRSAEIDHPAADRGRVLHPIPGVILPQQIPGGRVQGVKVVVIGTDVHHPVSHGGRGADDIPGGVAPQQRSGGRVQRIHRVVIRAGIHHPVNHRRGDYHPTAGGIGPEQGIILNRGAVGRAGRSGRPVVARDRWAGRCPLRDTTQHAK